MKRFAFLLIVVILVLTSCTKTSNDWWLEANYQNTANNTDYRMIVPFVLPAEGEFTGTGTLEVRDGSLTPSVALIQCTNEETSRARAVGQIKFIAIYQDNKIVVESLEPIGTIDAFSLVYYCNKDGSERDIRNSPINTQIQIGYEAANVVLNSFFVFTDALVILKLEPTDGFSGQDDKGFTYRLHKGILPEERTIFLPNASK